MASKADFDNFEGEFDLGAFRDWEKNPYSRFVFDEIRRMANLRMTGLRAALHSDKLNQASELGGELNALEEVLQIGDLLADDWKTMLGEVKKNEESK